MKKIFSLLCAVFFLSSLAGCGDSSDDSAVDPPGGGGGGEETEELYWNPVIKYSAPDPTCIRTADGTYYLYGTEDTRNMPIYKSDDLVNWTFVGTAFTEATRPDFPTSVSYDDPSLWAPEIRYIKGKYVLFYSLAKWGQEWLSTVGYALSDSPEGPFVPKGYVFTSEQVNVQNSIDQFFWEEGGKYYMLWGSFHGLFMVELDVTDDWNITPKLDTKVQLAGNAYEGVNVWKHGGYYYLFVSYDFCCRGLKSNYKVVVGRSKDVTGPYIDKEGRKLTQGGGSLVIGQNDDFVAIGHSAAYHFDGKDYFMAHGYSRTEDGASKLFLREMTWDEAGWPVVEP